MTDNKKKFTGTIGLIASILGIITFLGISNISEIKKIFNSKSTKKEFIFTTSPIVGNWEARDSVIMKEFISKRFGYKINFAKDGNGTLQFEMEWENSSYKQYSYFLIECPFTWESDEDNNTVSIKNGIAKVLNNKTEGPVYFRQWSLNRQLDDLSNKEFTESYEIQKNELYLPSENYNWDSFNKHIIFERK